MKNFFIRLKYKLKFFTSYSKHLNQCVEIENQLALIAQGKKPLPTKEDCRVMGLKLGTPKDLWPDEWK